MVSVVLDAPPTFEYCFIIGQVEKLSCARCGGALPARLLAPELTCPHCGHRQRLDPATLASLEGYRDEAGRDLAEAESHRGKAQAHAAQTRQMRLGQRLVMVVIAPLMIATMLGIVGVPLLHGAGFIDWNAMSGGAKVVVGAAILAVSVLGGIAAAVAVAVAERRQRKARSAVGKETSSTAAVASTVLCPRCGGPNALAVGVATEQCMYCQSTFAASEATRAAGLDASERARREAALVRYQKERTFVAGYGSQNKGTAALPNTAVAALLPGVFGPILCLGSGFGAIQTVTGAAEHDWAGVLVGGLAGLVLIVVAAGFAWLTRKQMLAAGERVLEAAGAYGGTPIRGLMATAAWLGRHWAGPFDLKQFHGASKGYFGAEGWVAGYPWLFEVDPDGANTRAQVIVAAFHADKPDPSNAPEQVRQALESLRADGADVTISEAGARALVAPESVTPQRITRTRDRLAFVVARLGGRPLR